MHLTMARQWDCDELLFSSLAHDFDSTLLDYIVCMHIFNLWIFLRCASSRPLNNQIFPALIFNTQRLSLIWEDMGYFCVTSEIDTTSLIDMTKVTVQRSVCVMLSPTNLWRL